MFGDPIRNPRGIQIEPLKALGKWSSGGTPSRSNPDYFTGEINWFAAGELNELYLEDSQEKITNEAIQNSAAKIFPKGSLLIGMYDTAAFKMGVLQKDSSANQACACIIPNGKVNVLWLYHILQIMKPHFLQNRRGIRQKNLNLGMIREFMIPLPEIDLQNQFAHFVEQTDKSKFRIKQSLEKLETLYKALLQKYFG